VSVPVRALLTGTDWKLLVLLSGNRVSAAIACLSHRQCLQHRIVGDNVRMYVAIARPSHNVCTPGTPGNRVSVPLRALLTGTDCSSAVLLKAC